MCMLACLPPTGLFLTTQLDSRTEQDQSLKHQLTETGSSLFQGLVLYFDLPLHSPRGFMLLGLTTLSFSKVKIDIA